MTATPPFPDPVQWFEGMLLTPQHFQQASLHADQKLNYHVLRLIPFHHGVLTLKVDLAKLVVGIFRVLALEAVMPDGLIVIHPQPGDDDLEVSLLPIADQVKDRAAAIHLAVPAYTPGSATGGALSRFRSVEGPPAVDENTGDNEQAVPRLRPRLTLIVGAEVPQKFVSLPLAQVVHSNEAFRLREDYQPPTFTVTATAPLAEACRYIGKRLREKASFLAGRLRVPAAIKGPVLSDTRHAVQCLTTELPLLEAILATGSAHPFTLHGLLCRIAGQVAALGPGLLPPTFEAYDHDDVLRSTGPLMAFIERMINTISETYVIVYFAAEETGFRLRMEAAWLTDRLLIGVRLAPGQTEADADGWIMDSLIASSENMGLLRERRIRGANRQRVGHDDRLDVMPERGTLLFRIDTDPGFVLPGMVLEIANAADRRGLRRPAEIVLYVARPGGSAGS